MKAVVDHSMYDHTNCSHGDNKNTHRILPLHILHLFSKCISILFPEKLNILMKIGIQFSLEEFSFLNFIFNFVGGSKKLNRN